MHHRVDSEKYKPTAMFFDFFNLRLNPTPAVLTCQSQSIYETKTVSNSRERKLSQLPHKMNPAGIENQIGYQKENKIHPDSEWNKKRMCYTPHGTRPTTTGTYQVVYKRRRFGGFIQLLDFRWPDGGGGMEMLSKPEIRLSICHQLDAKLTACFLANSKKLGKIKKVQ